VEVKTLKVTAANGEELDINVIDIIKSVEFGKEYVIYSVDLDEDNLYASVLKENEDGYNLLAIASEEEIQLVNKRIEEIAKEIDS